MAYRDEDRYYGGDDRDPYSEGYGYGDEDEDDYFDDGPVDEWHTDDELEPPVKMDTGFDRIIVVDNLPLVSEEKRAKLLGVVEKIMRGIPNAKVTSVTIDMPSDPSTNMSLGFAFIEFASAAQAAAAVEVTNGLKLGAAHILEVTPYDDFSRFEKIPDEYETPEAQPFEPRENLLGHLADPLGRDQFIARYGDETELWWNGSEADRTPKLEYSRTKWTESFVKWSPNGSFLATVHRQGVILWGGKSWKNLMRCSHPGVKHVMFTPNEQYLITWNGQKRDDENPQNPGCVIVWDVRSGKRLRGFHGSMEGWPAFKCSHDGKYLARIGENKTGNTVLMVYQTPDMNLVDKKSVKVLGVRDFQWSPTENILSMVVPEQNAQPARILLMEFPSRKEIRQKNLFNVTACAQHWQTDGDFLAVKVDRSKTKRTTTVNFELFRLREKDIPVETLEMKSKEAVHAFDWEPSGTRFCVVHGMPPRPDVSFYEMARETKAEARLRKQKAASIEDQFATKAVEEVQGMRLVSTLKSKTCNGIFWSPRGRFCLLAGLRNLNGHLEFYDADKDEILGTDEHFMATEAEWDPTGRYVATAVSQWRTQHENGYQLWTFAGRSLHKFPVEKFYQFIWRPRPKTTLTKAQLAEIKRDLKKYMKRYEEEVKAARAAMDAERNRARLVIYEDYRRFINDVYERQQDVKRQRKEMFGQSESDEETETVETVQESVLETREETMFSTKKE